jgi:hypothetical protein
MKLNIKKISSLFIITIMLFFTAASFFGSVTAQITTDDSDGDGLKDTEEDTNGDGNFSDGETDLNNPDTDGDGIIDSEDNNPNKKGDLEQYHGDEKGRNDAANNMVNIFFFTFLMSFAVFSLIAGVFTAYFGAGKSRAIGGALLVIGLVVILIWVYFGILQSYPDDTIIGIVHWNAAKTLEAFITVIGALIGAVIAIVLFLVAIMKS